jgi:8-oxo-dGTP pyrophosphatase MutT (NUDIX family)
MVFAGADEADDAEHARALKESGFWGKKGAGCVFFAKSTKRFLLDHRTNNRVWVQEPGTWGSYGGAIDKNELPLDAVNREAREETGGKQKVLQFIPLLIFRQDDFQYHNYLAVVATEFTPELTIESQGFKWCNYGDWPQPLHFGLIALFNDPASNKIMRQLAGQAIESRLLMFADGIQDIKLNHATASYKIHHGVLEIYSVRVPQKYRRSGEAIAIMQRLVAIADAKHLPCKLLASPLDQRTKIDKLVQFYGKFGFKWNGEYGNLAHDPIMERPAQ